MRVSSSLSLIGVVGLAATASAFMPASAPRGRQTEMILDNFFPKSAGTSSSTTTTTAAKAPAKAGGGKASSSSGRLNLKAIPKEAPKPAAKKATPAAPALKLPTFSFGAPKPKAAAAEVTAKMVNGKLVGYFTEEQVIALEEARRAIPSNAPQYWQKISAQVPGTTPDTCKAMANQIQLDKARGTGKNFFGGYVEVKETKMVVDESATPMNRIKEAFGFK